MIHSGVRQFRDRATHFLAGDDVVAIERHGKVIGFYIPVAVKQEEESRLALEQLQQAVARVMNTSGLTEDELSRMFDLNQPLP